MFCLFQYPLYVLFIFYTFCNLMSSDSISCSLAFWIRFKCFIYSFNWITLNCKLNSHQPSIHPFMHVFESLVSFLFLALLFLHDIILRLYEIFSVFKWRSIYIWEIRYNKKNKKLLINFSLWKRQYWKTWPFYAYLYLFFSENFLFWHNIILYDYRIYLILPGRC
jgi:hypothetical protein